jgi:hypothetical protein
MTLSQSPFIDAIASAAPPGLKQLALSQLDSPLVQLQIHQP